MRVKVLGALALVVSAGLFLAFTDRRRDGRGTEGAEWGVGRHRGVRDGQAPAL